MKLSSRLRMTYKAVKQKNLNKLQDTSHKIRYDTIVQFNVDSKAEYTP